jgi:hypothetical protein
MWRPHVCGFTAALSPEGSHACLGAAQREA